MAKPVAERRVSDFSEAAYLATSDNGAGSDTEDVNLLQSVMRDVMRAEVVGYLEAWRKEMRVDLLAIGKEFQSVSTIGFHDLRLRIDKIEDMLDKRLTNGDVAEEDFNPKETFTGEGFEMSNSNTQQNQKAVVQMEGTKSHDLPKEILDKLHNVRLMREESATAKTPTSVNEYFLMVLTVVSTVYVGIDTATAMDAAVLSVPRPALYRQLDLALTGLFIVQLLPRLYFEGKGFWTGPLKAWNIFDVIIVITDILSKFAGPTIDPGVTRVVRLARLTRISAIMRFSHLVDTLRMFTSSLREAVPFLMWTMLVQLILIYGVAIMLSGNISHWLEENEEHSMRDALVRQHGAFSRSMFTLFKVLLGGSLWETSIRPLKHVGAFNGIIFLVWLVIARCLMLMALTASVCAFFVNKAQDIEYRARMSKFFGAGAMQELQALLESRCGPGERMIDLVEYQNLLEDDEKAVSALQHLKIDRDVMFGLFHVLDIAGEGAVNIDHVLRCVPSCNDGVDVITLKFETKRLSDMIMGMRQSMHEVLDLVNDGQKRGCRRTSSELSA